MATTDELRGVRLDAERTTMTLPHKRTSLGGYVYFVGIYPEGDLAIHKWEPRDPTGYGGDCVTFLLEDGSFETVKGPWSCGDIWDFGQAKTLSEHLEIPNPGPAFTLRVGYKELMMKWAQILKEESCLRCGNFHSRLREIAADMPADAVVGVMYRNGVRTMRRKEVMDELASHHDKE